MVPDALESEGRSLIQLHLPMVVLAEHVRLYSCVESGALIAMPLLSLKLENVRTASQHILITEDIGETNPSAWLSVCRLVTGHPNSETFQVTINLKSLCCCYICHPEPGCSAL